MFPGLVSLTDRDYPTVGQFSLSTIKTYNSVICLLKTLFSTAHSLFFVLFYDFIQKFILSSVPFFLTFTLHSTSGGLLVLGKLGILGVEIFSIKKRDLANT